MREVSLIERVYPTSGMVFMMDSTVYHSCMPCFHSLFIYRCKGTARNNGGIFQHLSYFEEIQENIVVTLLFYNYNISSTSLLRFKDKLSLILFHLLKTARYVIDYYAILSILTADRGQGCL